MTKQAVAVILKSPQGHYALQLRDDKPGIRSPGKWGLFGGEIEEDELPLSAAIREIREELGVELNPDRVEYFGPFPDIENNMLVNVYKYTFVEIPRFTLTEGAGWEWINGNDIISHNKTWEHTMVFGHYLALAVDLKIAT